MSLVLVPKRVEVKLHAKIMMINHYAASIIAHYDVFNMAAVFTDGTLGELQTASLCHPHI